LDKNARTVAGLVVGTLGTAVLHILQHTETVFDNVVALCPVDINHESHPAGIVFVSGVVETPLLWIVLIHSFYFTPFLSDK
jgi:hypothetical protein